MCHWAIWWCLWILMRLQSFQIHPLFIPLPLGPAPTLQVVELPNPSEMCVCTGKESLFSSPGPCCWFEAVGVKSDVTQPLPQQRCPQTPLSPGTENVPACLGAGGARWDVSYIIILLHHHGVRGQAQMTGSGSWSFPSDCISWRPSSHCPPLPPLW